MRSKVVAVLVTVTVGVLTVLAPMVTPASSAASRDVVGSVPARTPAVLDGEVWTIQRVGGTVVAGGTFTQAQSVGGDPVSRTYLFAFDPGTGRLSETFAPVLDGAVKALVPGPTPGTVYVGGSFTRINGAAHSHVALLDVTTGLPVAGFKASTTNGAVNAMAVSGGRLYVGGYFTTAGGAAHAGLASLDAGSGAVTPFVNTQMSEHQNNTGSGAQAPIGVRDLDVTPDGTRLVVIGNFRKVDDLSRIQVVMLSLDGPSATVTPDWRTDRYNPYCFSWAYDAYVRGVDVSPDGSFFVVTTTGGYGAGTLCDTAARFEVRASGQTIQPTWVDYSGGDTLWSNEITETAVYVGGHNRWMNNSLSGDNNGPGSVPRPGLAALDPDSGMPLRWNPGRNPRGDAVYALHHDGTGLWLGMDTSWIGNFEYLRPRLAYFPEADGYDVEPDRTGSLPGTAYLLSPNAAGGNSDTTRRIELAPDSAARYTAGVAGGVSWRNTRGAFMVNDTLYYGWADGMLHRRTFDGTTFGPDEVVDPYNDPAWANVSTGSGDTYVGLKSGLYGELANVTGMFYANNRIYYTLRNQSALYSRWFSTDSAIVGADRFSRTGPVDYNTYAVAFVANNRLYLVSRLNGSLYQIAWNNGAPSGSPVLVNSATSGNDWRARGLVLLSTRPNAQPTARMTVQCQQLDCSFDATTSTDADGSITGYHWDFGDGTTATGSTARHTYSSGGARTVTLTVTDDDGAVGTSTQEVSLSDGVSTAQFLGADQALVSGASARVTTPPGVAKGDTLLVLATVAVTSPVPATPPGWTAASQRVSGGMVTYLYTRTASATDAGAATTVDVGAATKIAAVVAAYRNVRVRSVGSLAEASGTHHVTPTATAQAGDWVVQYWSDKSSSTTQWTPPGGVSVRATGATTLSGRVSHLLADSGGPVSAGTAGGQTAVTDAASTRATTWTIVLESVEPAANVPPTAKLQISCEQLDCAASSAGSADPDGEVVGYLWRFGDGGESTDANPLHTYARGGTYEVTLTVTDDRGGSTTASRTLEVQASTALSFVGANGAGVAASTGSVGVPAGTALGDTMLLFVNSATTSPVVTAPPGWTPVGTRVSGGMATYLWRRTAALGDLGSTVTVDAGTPTKLAVQLLAYRGATLSDAASLAEASGTSHTTPVLAATAGSWVVSYWADKSSSTTAWTAPPGVAVRHTAYTTLSGRVTALVADSGAPVAAGPAGGLVATTDASSTRAATWTVLLAPAG